MPRKPKPYIKDGWYVTSAGGVPHRKLCPVESGEKEAGRMLAYTRNETMQILRDPVRLTFAFLGSALLMLVFGFGITTDVEHIRYAAHDEDRSPESRNYLEQFASSPRWFTRGAPVVSGDEGLHRLAAALS